MSKSEKEKAKEQEEIDISVMDIMMRIDRDHSMFLETEEMQEFMDILYQQAVREGKDITLESLYELIPEGITFHYAEALIFFRKHPEISKLAVGGAADLYNASTKTRLCFRIVPSRFLYNFRRSSAKDKLKKIQTQIDEKERLIEEAKKREENEKKADEVELAKLDIAATTPDGDTATAKSDDKEKKQPLVDTDLVAGSVYNTYKRAIEFFDLATSLILLNTLYYAGYNRPDNTGINDYKIATVTMFISIFAPFWIAYSALLKIALMQDRYEPTYVAKKGIC